MIHAVRSAAVLLLLALLPATATAAAPRASVKTDWARAFSVSPEGGFRMGNPKAKIAVVEYGSLTCPHCRHFAETAVKPLVDGYVRPGKASYEFRPYLLNGVDLAATLVARCNGPSRFFPMAETLYATQPEWVGKVTGLPPAEIDRMTALPQEKMLLAVAKVTGLVPAASAHGIPPVRAQMCLKDASAALGLAKMEQAASKIGVDATPTIFVNGKQVPAYDWDTLQPFLKEAGG
jgi:protein-disulfide isomerase